MVKRYDAWYADVLYANGDMDKEFFNTLTQTLKYAMEESRASKTVIGREYGDFRYIDTVDYPVFGILHKMPKGVYVYVGKTKPNETDKSYRVYSNGALRPMTAKRDTGMHPFGL